MNLKIKCIISACIFSYLSANATQISCGVFKNHSYEYGIRGGFDTGIIIHTLCEIPRGTDDYRRDTGLNDKTSIAYLRRFIHTSLMTNQADVIRDTASCSDIYYKDEEETAWYGTKTKYRLYSIDFAFGDDYVATFTTKVEKDKKPYIGPDVSYIGDISVEIKNRNETVRTYTDCRVAGIDTY